VKNYFEQHIKNKTTITSVMDDKEDEKNWLL